MAGSGRGGWHRGPSASSQALLAMTERLLHPEKIPLADIDAAVPQDAVRGRGVEIEIRERKARQELLARHRQRIVGPGGEGHILRVRALELRRLERLHIVDGLRQPL